MRVFKDNLSHAVGPKIGVADVVVSTNHLVFLANRFPRLISLPKSAIFVSRTRGIAAILKYSLTSQGHLAHIALSEPMT